MTTPHSRPLTVTARIDATLTPTTPYQPAPGSEFPFSIGDIAFATAHALGEGFTGDSSSWGVNGEVRGEGDVWVIEVEDADLCLRPKSEPEPIQYFTDLRPADGLTEIAAVLAEAIRTDIAQMRHDFLHGISEG